MTNACKFIAIDAENLDNRLAILVFDSILTVD